MCKQRWGRVCLLVSVVLLGWIALGAAEPTAPTRNSVLCKRAILVADSTWGRVPRPTDFRGLVARELSRSGIKIITEADTTALDSVFTLFLDAFGAGSVGDNGDTWYSLNVVTELCLRDSIARVERWRHSVRFEAAKYVGKTNWRSTRVSFDYAKPNRPRFPEIFPSFPEDELWRSVVDTWGLCFPRLLMGIIAWHERADLGPLLALLSTKDEGLRRESATLLGALGDARAREPLQDAMAREASAKAQAAMEKAIRRLEPKKQ